jgi:hypothetical protein
VASDEKIRELGTLLVPRSAGLRGAKHFSHLAFGPPNSPAVLCFFKSEGIALMYEKPQTEPMVLSNVLAIGPCQGKQTEVALLQRSEAHSLLIRILSPRGDTRRSLAMGPAWKELDAEQWFISGSGNHYWVGYQNCLALQDLAQGEISATVAVSEPLQQMRSNPSGEPFSALVSTGSSALLVRPNGLGDFKAEADEIFADANGGICVGYTLDQHGVILTEEGGTLYGLHPTLRFANSIQWPKQYGPPKSVVPYGSHGFAVMARDHIVIY